MSSKTADTEEETLESPTPPKMSPSSPDPREDQILEDEDEDEEDEEAESSGDETATERQGAAHYHSGQYTDDGYTDGSSDLYSGDIECCFSVPACFGFNRGSSDTLAEQSDDSFVMIVLMQLALLAFCSFIVVWFLIGYLMPGCLCSNLFAHISGLPLSAKLLAFVCLVFFTSLWWMLYYSIRSIMRKEYKGLMAIISMTMMLFIASCIANVIAIYKAGGWTSYLIYDSDFYNNAGTVFMKDDIRNAISTLAMFGQGQGVEETLHNMFYEEGLFQLEAIERTFKWFVLGGWFLFNIGLIVILCNIVKLRRMFYQGQLDGISHQSGHQSLRQTHSRSHSTLKSKKRSPSKRMDRPPSYRHVSPPKSVRSSYSTTRSVRNKMRNFNNESYSNHYAPQPQMNPYHHHATLPRGEIVPLNQTMPVNTGNYYTVQRNPQHFTASQQMGQRPRRQNQKREDFLY